MTEKRFKMVSFGFLTSFEDNGVKMTHKQIVECLNNLHEENEQLKSKLFDIGEDRDYFKAKASGLEEGYLQLQGREIRLKKENEQLKQRNENQYRQLQHLWSLMKAKDWETLSDMVTQMKKDNERLQKEWKCYE